MGQEKPCAEDMHRVPSPVLLILCLAFYVAPLKAYSEVRITRMAAWESSLHPGQAAVITGQWRP